MTIRPISDAQDLHQVYRLRYEIYVAEMGRRQSHVDHARRMITDPLDRDGHIFGAWDGDALVGTVRSNFIRCGEIGEYSAYYQVDRITEAPSDAISITTRLMIRPGYRMGSLAVRLANAVFAFGLSEGIDVDLIDCNAHLKSFFGGLGYVDHADLAHPDYGAVTVMKLNARDRAHLEAVGSPFKRILAEHESSPVLALAS